MKVVVVLTEEGDVFGVYSSALTAEKAVRGHLIAVNGDDCEEEFFSYIDMEME